MARISGASLRRFFRTVDGLVKGVVVLAVFLVGSGSASRAVAAESILTEGVVDAPVAAVWAVWWTSAGLESWLAPHADIDLRVGGLMRATYDAKGVLGDAGTIVNQVLSFEPERMLSIQVAQAPAAFPFRDIVSTMWTVVYFRPTPDDRTELRIVGLGFTAAAQSQQMKAFFQQGNAYTLAQLQKRFTR